MEWMLMPLRRYAEFTGRSQRKEFWMWLLGVIIVTVILSILDTVLGLGGRSWAGRSDAPGSMAVGANATGGLLTTLFSLAILIPNLAVSVRRLHDTNRSGWWLLLPVVPYVLGIGMMIAGGASGSFATIGLAGILMFAGFVCGVVLLVFYCLDGTPGANDYGPDPKGGTADLAETFQ